MTSPPIGTDEELIEALLDERRRTPFEPWARERMKAAADALQSRISEVERLRERVSRLGELLVKYGDSIRMANAANSADQQLIDEVFGDD